MLLMSVHVIPHTTQRVPMAAHPHSTAEYAAASGSETYSGFESESLGGSFDSSPDQESTDPALSVDDGRASRPEEKQAVGVQNTGILLDLQDDGACLRGVEISISDPEKRQGSNAVNMRELFTVYLVEARFVDGDREPTSVWRRYSEFEVLRNYLLVTHPYVVIPPLPEKRAEFVWHKLSADNMDPDFVERRRVGLETFLLRVIEHLQLSRDPIVSSFLSQENGWKETVNNTEFQAKADSLLKSLSATFRVKNPDKRFVELKCYCDELHTIISQLLKVQMRVADRLYGIYKIHANYGRVFSEWSAIEKDMGDGLQSAGHHMDVYAVSIDDMLEEEEHYADHLKEFLYYTESLRSVCSKHELLQYELEQLQYALLAKKQQREELSTGMVRMFSLKGVTSKLFGQETAEQRQSKLQLVDKQIAEDERCVSAKQQENRDFVEKAWQDVERFQRQKYKDLKETIRSYATMQMNMCKKGIAVWTNAKECFNKI